MEEKIEKLVSKCYEKDKFIRHVGSVLRGCRCGIVSASLLEELALAESQLEKPDYQQLVSPHASTTSHVRLQGDTISTAWSSLGTISSQLLTKQEQSSQQVSTSLSSSQQLPDTQYVQVAESRAYPVSESAIAASYVEGDLSAPRYVSEVVVTMPQSEQYESRLIVSQIDHQYHGSIADRGDGSTETGQRHLLNNFSELTYENFVDNVSYPPESPESNSEIYTLNSPVITQLLDKPRLDSAEPKRESLGTILKGQFGELKHFCKTCNKGFSLKSRLINHRRSHTGEKPYKCNICKKTFSHGGSLTYHKRIHSGEKPYKCLECGKSFSQPGHLTSHSVLHTKKYKCSLCTKSFTREEILERHMTTHNDNTKVQPTSCEHCGRNFRCKKNLLKHLRKYCAKLHGYKCLKCGNVFSSDEELFIHRQVHSRSHQCKICLKYFNRPSSLQAHKLRYRGRCMDPSVSPKALMENLRCRNCGKLFSHMRSLTKHVRRYCGQDNELMCKRCGKVFPSVPILEVHKKIHNTVKYHQCEVCQLSFRRPGLLRVHRVIHGSGKEELKDGEGSIEKTTNPKGSKKRKPRTKKVKAKKYCIKEFLQCMNCGKVCSSIEDLENHSDEHSLGKPHKCDICLKRFFRPVRLQAHKSSFVDGHNKAKPHQPVRVKVKVLIQGSSPVNSDLEGNIDREYDQDGYHFQCEFCQKIFKREALLRKHQLTNDSCKSEKNSLDETSDENSAVDSDGDLETSTSDISCLWGTMKEDHFESSLRENPELENSTQKSLNVESSTIDKSVNESKTKEKAGLKSWKHQCEICFKKFRQPEMLNAHKLSCVESGIQKSGIEGFIGNKSKLDGSVKEKSLYQESIPENIELEESMTYNLNPEEAMTDKPHPEESMTDKPHLEESMTDKPHLEESMTDKPHLEGIVKDKANAERSKQDKPDHGDGMQNDFTGAEESSLDRIFECFDCGKFCSSFDALDKHGEEHSKKKPHKCDVCLRRFMRPGRLLAHKLSYRQGDKKGKPHIPWKMKISPYTDETKKTHSVVYINETPDFQGSINELPLEGTVIEMHDVEDSRNKMVDLEDAIKEIPDTIAGTSNLKRGNLGNLHMCELCGKCYPNRSSLKNHRRTHTGEKPYMCDLCGHFFTTGSGLKIHRLSHSGIKNFKCEQCNKSFVSSHNLQCHLLVHNRPKSFTCKICGRECKLLSNLKRHMTTHK